MKTPKELFEAAYSQARKFAKNHACECSCGEYEYELGFLHGMIYGELAEKLVDQKRGTSDTHTIHIKGEHVEPDMRLTYTGDKRYLKVSISHSGPPTTGVIAYVLP